MAVGDFLTWSVQGQDAPAHVGRLLQTILLNEGVVDVAGGSFETTEDTGANMNITVGSGTLGDLAVVEGDDTAGQGVYVIEAQNATVTKTIAASDPSDDRIDLVVLQNYDDEADSSGNNDAEVEVIEGTPAGSPSAPALPDSAIPLAEILVGAGVTSITDANITDKREEARVKSELVDTVYFTSSDTFEKADYPWLRKVRVKVQAGGGGGAGAGTNDTGGGGGGGGGYAEAEVAVGDLSSSETVTVGAGGNGGGAGNINGFVGGTSLFGTHAEAAGGEGGKAPSTHRGGNGGGTSAGDLQIPGGGGGSGMDSEDTAGMGGNAVLGHGGRGSHDNLNGAAGGNYGAGGGGGSSRSINVSGGDGADGIVIVDLYA